MKFYLIQIGSMLLIVASLFSLGRADLGYVTVNPYTYESPGVTRDPRVMPYYSRYTYAIRNDTERVKKMDDAKRKVVEVMEECFQIIRRPETSGEEKCDLLVKIVGAEKEVLDLLLKTYRRDEYMVPETYDRAVRQLEKIAKFYEDLKRDDPIEIRFRMIKARLLSIQVLRHALFTDGILAYVNRDYDRFVLEIHYLDLQTFVRP